MTIATQKESFILKSALSKYFLPNGSFLFLAISLYLLFTIKNSILASNKKEQFDVRESVGELRGRDAHLLG